MSPLGLAERCKGPNILPAFTGSWCEGNLPSSTRGQRPVCRRTAPPNLSWRHLLRPSSFCRPCPGARPIPSTDGSSKGPELQCRPGSPWNGGVCNVSDTSDVSDIIFASSHTYLTLFLEISDWRSRTSLAPTWITILLNLHLALASTFKFAKMPGALAPSKQWTMVAGVSIFTFCTIESPITRALSSGFSVSASLSGGRTCLMF